MYINIIRSNGEFWVLTEKTAEPFGNLQAASRKAAELVYRAEEVVVHNDYYSIFLDFCEEDEKEKPDWSFVPFGTMQFFNALEDKRDAVKLASGDEEAKEAMRSLAIGKEMYR